MKNELNEEEKHHFIFTGKRLIYEKAICFLVDHLGNTETHLVIKYDVRLRKSGQSINIFCKS
jgi:hypothetical protein